VSNTITRAPWTWRLLRRPVTRFFDRVAPGWDQRYASNPDRLAPLTAALDLLPSAPERVLDVGTGTGAGALLMAERWPTAEVTGIDVAPAMIERAQAKTNDPRVSFLVADVATLDPGSGYDLVVLLNMPPFFEQMARLLRPGGHLVVFVPALAWLYSNFDREVGHFRRYSREGLRRIVEHAGFEVVSARYFDVAGVLPWYVYFTLMGRSMGKGSVSLYDRWVVPPMRLVESVVPPPLGKNVLLVGRRN